MPYTDPDKAREAKRESARRRRERQGSTLPSRTAASDQEERVAALESALAALQDRVAIAERKAAYAAAFMHSIDRCLWGKTHVATERDVVRILEGCVCAAETAEEALGGK